MAEGPLAEGPLAAGPLAAGPKPKALCRRPSAEGPLPKALLHLLRFYIGYVRPYTALAMILVRVRPYSRVHLVAPVHLRLVSVFYVWRSLDVCAMQYKMLLRSTFLFSES